MLQKHGVCLPFQKFTTENVAKPNILIVNGENNQKQVSLTFSRQIFRSVTFLNWKFYCYANFFVLQNPIIVIQDITSA